LRGLQGGLHKLAETFDQLIVTIVGDDADRHSVKACGGEFLVAASFSGIPIRLRAFQKVVAFLWLNDLHAYDCGDALY
jgi:hypothetical protein